MNPVDYLKQIFKEQVGNYPLTIYHYYEGDFPEGVGDVVSDHIDWGKPPSCKSGLEKAVFIRVDPEDIPDMKVPEKIPTHQKLKDMQGEMEEWVRIYKEEHGDEAT